MLTYKFVRPAFYFALLVIGVGYYFYEWNVWIWGSLVLAVYFAFICWGAYFIHSGFFLTAICKGKPEIKEIAITFDDGPNREVTPLVLDLLNRMDAKATFFCIGKNISENEDILKRLHIEGHTLGNHSWSHSYFFDFFRTTKVESELLQTNVAMQQITGKGVVFFRPPFGVTNPVIAHVVKKLGMRVVGWSIRSYDTTIRDNEFLFKRVTNRLQNGDIILFHDSQNRILPVLEKFLVFANTNGFKIVSLEKLIS